MAKRKIIKIDENKCNGCGLCIPNCPEGALQMIDGKVRLVSDLFCDGLGACIGHCPQGAITTEEREAEEYDERKVMENIVKQGQNVIKAHLRHLKEHGQTEYLKEAMGFLKEKGIKVSMEGIGERSGEEHGAHFSPCRKVSNSFLHCPPASLCEAKRGGKSSPKAIFLGCPGSKVMDFRGHDLKNVKVPSQLTHWPIQLKLVPASAPYFNNADLLISADCVPFSYGDFHNDLLKGRIVLVGCPKLDDAEFYRGKITQILKLNNIKSITCAYMEVPCCFGLVGIVKSALDDSGKKVPFREVTIGIKGEKI